MTGESSAFHTKKGLRYAVPSAGVKWSTAEGFPPGPMASQPQLADLQPPAHTDVQLLPLWPPPGFSGHLMGAQCPAVSFLKSQLPLDALVPIKVPWGASRFLPLACCSLEGAVNLSSCFPSCPLPQSTPRCLCCWNRCPASCLCPCMQQHPSRNMRSTASCPC